MSTKKNPLLTLSITATAALVANRFQGYDGAVATAAARAAGVTTRDTAIGAQSATDAIGTTTVEASAAIAVGAQIEVAAAGKAVTKSSGVSVAVALEAAGVSGDLIEVMLTPS